MTEEDRYFKIILQIVNARHGLDFSQRTFHTPIRNVATIFSHLKEAGVSM